MESPIRAIKRDIMDKETDGKEGKTEPRLKMDNDYNDIM